MTIASIDMGTNTVRLLIAKQLENCKFDFLHQESKIARIGEGFKAKKTISDKALDRTIKILKYYKDIIEKFKAKYVFIVATSAVREAENKDWFIQTIKDETGFNIDIISPNKEAYLTQLGIVYNIENIIKNKKWIAFDLGGGSTEFMFSEGKELKNSISIPLGVVKLLEMFIKHDPPMHSEIEKAQSYFIKTLSQHESFNKDIDFLVGNAGTVTSLAAIELNLDRYSYKKTETYKLKQTSIEKIFRELMSLKSSERLIRYKILEKGREDVIVVGAAIVNSILKFFSKDFLITTNGSLREGLLIERLCE